MIIYRLNPAPHVCETGFYQTVCALGLFDGVHVGHTALLCEAVQQADRLGATPIVFTFADGNYKNQDGSRPPLYTLEERLALFAAQGMEYAAIAEFSEICHLTPHRFVCEILCDRLQVKCAVCGSDFRFGAQGMGSAHTLKEEMEAKGNAVLCLPPVCFGAGQGAQIKLQSACYSACSLGCTPVSTTVIRQMLLQGQMEDAARLLGRPFGVKGRVDPGYRIGRTWGFPTANLTLPKEKQLLPLGVYVCRCYGKDGQNWDAIGNYGRCPTVREGGQPHLEVFLFTEENVDLYGTELKVELLHFLRAEKKFDSVQALQAEIERNVSQAKEYLQKKR